jgi:hypothetical protein
MIRYFLHAFCESGVYMDDNGQDFSEAPQFFEHKFGHRSRSPSGGRRVVDPASSVSFGRGPWQLSRITATSAALRSHVLFLTQKRHSGFGVPKAANLLIALGQPRSGLARREKSHTKVGCLCRRIIDVGPKNMAKVSLA